jgi:plastocyanin
VRRTFRPVAIVALLMLAGACHSASGTETPTSAPPATAVSPTVGAETGIGSDITITDQGFAPEWLLAAPGQTITFHNTTDQTWSVIFDHQDVRSGPIRPGETFEWSSPTPISVTYHAGDASAFDGKIQVQSV